MPLKPGSSRADIAANIRELKASSPKRPQDQIIAIALRKAGKASKKRMK